MGPVLFWLGDDAVYHVDDVVAAISSFRSGLDRSCCALGRQRHGGCRGGAASECHMLVFIELLIDYTEERREYAYTVAVAPVMV